MDLEPPELELTLLSDSSDYFLYHYELTNPAASTDAIAMLSLDVSAGPGTPDSVLPSTGFFWNTGASATVPFDPHVPLGVSSPNDWEAFLVQGGRLWWSAPTPGIAQVDSVAPGASRSGYAVRSPYLPGIREVDAWPTWQSCCMEGDSLHPERGLPEQGEFAVTGIGVGPRYAPDEVDLDLLESQIDTVCDDPLWLTNSALCAELADSLDAAQARDASNDHWGVLSAVQGVLDIIVANPQEMHSNAYYLLGANAGQVIANINDPSPPPMAGEHSVLRPVPRQGPRPERQKAPPPIPDR
jgi:hypothetical protein